MVDHRVIDTRDAYLAATAALSEGTGPIGIDAERASGFTYSQRAYLIQMYRRGAGTFLFDPPAIGDFSELNAAIAGDEWIFHAASQDLACLREVGLDPHIIFDTELAARLLGLPRVGLGTVVEELLGIHLAKEHSAANWSTRPLPESWLVYGALDVELLPDLRDRMVEMLAADEKTQIAAQEFQATLDHEPKPISAEPWRRLSGVHSIRSQRNLAVARSLWLARDDLARHLDVSPGRLVPDASLVAAARVLPASRQALADLREFSGRASRSELDRWWTAIQDGIRATDLPSLRGIGDALPPPRAWSDRNPEADLRYKAARLALGQISESFAIPIENLVTPDFVRRIAWTPPEPIEVESISEALAALGARDWQIELTAQQITAAFVEANQNIAVTVEVDS
ncbi:HRDC domain-containing protein [Cryobacterium sp. 10I1]|uniref:HRDC domain-containing protein n=1 Tax=unclassified Cryobacterium TaxID=2649013 RepID=UPI002AC89C9C|nr:MULTISPECIES: HRDC domain-containing protein [unclassified Cryobacterium]MEB0288046.1 HRDC domain-containing protein [Cryobacterium sp. 10S3]MEB0304635.1 HRDC domain-containing protein [Cryobacterium sp. 10I1]WPX15365.1 HRDC domain-containing protein [Cryobacterium sp. 10S3]